MKRQIGVAFILMWLMLPVFVMAQTKRGRNEGTMNIPASNVVGSGNITASSALSGSYGSDGLYSMPWLGLKVGVAHIIQLTGRVTIENFTRLGVVEGHLQITTPGNDRLRFIGVAISGDLYLSTEIDTLSGAAITGRPEYNSYIRPSLIADLDWITRFKTVPLKTFISIGFADNPDLLFMYSQLSMRLGVELKLNRNSYSVDVGAGFYKEKKSSRAGAAADQTYKQQQLWIEPSIRYRLFDKSSILLGARVLLFQRVKKAHPLPSEYVRVSAAFEVPIAFRETNSEAIRTMMFVEQQSSKERDTLQLKRSGEENENEQLRMMIDGVDLDITTSESDEAALKRRKEIQDKMDEIEQLLEELE